MNERFLKLLKHPATLPIAASVMSFGAGVFAGYIFGRRNKFEVHDEPAQLKFDLDASTLRRDEDRTEEEVAIAESQAFLDEIDRKKELKERGGDIATPAEAFILEHLDGTVVLENEPEPHPIEAVAQSIFAQSTDEWNYDEEVKNRRSETPYVIHRDEFYAEELGYEQTTMTYYSGDNIMANQEDSPVYNYNTIVGPLLFGHGSPDPNVFHVRNESRREEYEIVFDSGHFAIEVLGLEEEANQDLKHTGPPKFRPE